MRIRIRCPDCKATTIVIDTWAEPKGGLYSDPGVELSQEEPRRAPEIYGEHSLIAAAVAQLSEDCVRVLLRELLMTIPGERIEGLGHWAEVIAALESKDPKLIGALVVKALEVRERVLALYGAEMVRLGLQGPDGSWIRPAPLGSDLLPEPDEGGTLE